MFGTALIVPLHINTGDGAVVSEHSCTKGFISRLPKSEGWQIRNSIPFLYLYTYRRELLEYIGKKNIKVGMKHVFFLCIFYVFFCGNMLAVEKDLTVPAPGKLKSLVDKKEFSDITSLTIRGEINDKDIKVLENFLNLTTLDMRGVSGTFSYLPTFAHLEQLYLPSDCKNNHRTVKGKDYYLSDCIMANKTIHTLSISGEIAEKVKGMINLKKMEIHGKTQYQGCGSSINSYAKNDLVSIDTLVLWNLHGDYHQVETAYNYLMPRYIVDGNTHEVYLNAYEPNRTDYKGINILPNLNDIKNAQITTPDYLDLSDVHVIPYDYFRNCTMKNVKFSESLRFVGSGAFSKCANITSLIFPGENTSLILEGWFDGCKNLKEVHFRCPVQIDGRYGGYGNNMVLTFDKPSAVAFTSMATGDAPFDHFVFNAVPTALVIGGEYGCVFQDIVSYIEIPKGTKEDIFALCPGANNKNCFEQGIDLKSCNIKMEKPGTILSYLPIDELENIDSLTITGFLYETDINVIEKCVRLKHLDIGKTVITYSPELLKQQRDNAKALASLFGMLGAMADAKYENNEMGTLDYAYTKAFSNLMQDTSNVKESNINCIIPTNAFSNMYFLQSVILPYRASQIGSRAFASCVNLKEVALPLYLESIGSECFMNCTKLKIIQFPKTLNEIGERCFNGCNSIEMVDLSQCDFTPKTKSSYRNHTDWPQSFYHCAKLRELRLPQGITRIKASGYYEIEHNQPRPHTLKVYFPKSLEELGNLSNWGDCELHFKTVDAPGHLGDAYYKGNAAIYCPKGGTTSYFNAVDGHVERIKIIEE